MIVFAFSSLPPPRHVSSLSAGTTLTPSLHLATLDSDLPHDPQTQRTAKQNLYLPNKPVTPNKTYTFQTKPDALGWNFQLGTLRNTYRQENIKERKLTIKYVYILNSPL